MMLYDNKPQAQALGAVSGLITSRLREGLRSSEPTPEYQVFIVWYAYVLGNWKALVSSSLDDGLYYETTFNKEKNELYVDTYGKINNIAIKLEEVTS